MINLILIDIRGGLLIKLQFRLGGVVGPCLCSWIKESINEWSRILQRRRRLRSFTETKQQDIPQQYSGFILCDCFVSDVCSLFHKVLCVVSCKKSNYIDFSFWNLL